MSGRAPLDPRQLTPRRIAVYLIVLVLTVLVGTALIALGVGNDGYQRVPLPADIRPLVVAACLLIFGTVVLWRVLLRR